jgi:hypothetical protein
MDGKQEVELRDLAKKLQRNGIFLILIARARPTAKDNLKVWTVHLDYFIPR